MKKLSNIILISIMTLLVMPKLVSAEVKEIGDTVYVTEEFLYKDYLCEDLKEDVLYLAEVYKEKLVIYNETKDKFYLVDLDKNDNCTAMTTKELEEMSDELYTENFVYYRWKDDNKIHKLTDRYDSWGYGYVLTDNINEKNTYYEFVDEEWVEVEDTTDKDSLYEYKLFAYPSGEFDENEEYYYVPEAIPELFEKVENPTEEEFDSGMYLVKSDYVIKDEVIASLDGVKFVLPKEISETDSDITFTNEDLWDVYVTEDEIYLLFWGDLSSTTLFTLDGTLIETSLVESISISDNNVLYIINDKDIVSLLDSTYNLIYQTKKSSNILMFPQSLTLNNSDYFFYIDEEENEKLIKLSHYYLEDGANQTYKNNDLVFKFSGNKSILSSVKINGKELSNENYSVESGSTVITLSKKYLSTLTSGTYTLKVEYSDGGYSSTTFTIEENVPNTFDGITSYIVLGLVSLIGLIGVTIFMKKNKRVN